MKINEAGSANGTKPLMRSLHDYQQEIVISRNGKYKKAQIAKWRQRIESLLDH